MKKITFVILFLLQNTCSIFAQLQQNKIDSLFKVIERTSSDTARVNNLNAVSAEFYSGANPDSAIRLADKARLLANEVHYQWGIAQAFYITSVSLMSLRKGEAALQANGKAFKIYDKLLKSGEFTRARVLLARAKSYSVNGLIYYDLANYEKSMVNHKQALQEYKAIGNRKEEAKSFNNIGNLCFNLGDYNEAIINHSKSLSLKIALDDKKGIANSFSNIANSYFALGNYPETVKQMSAALKIRLELDDKSGCAESYHNIGNVYFLQGNHPAAIKHYFASLKIKEELGDKQGIAASYINIGNIYYTQKNYDEALIYYRKSLNISQEISDKPKIAEAYQNIGSTLSEQGERHNKEALEFYTKALALNEEMNTQQSIADNLISIGLIYSRTGNYDLALTNLFRALKICLETQHQQYIATAYRAIGSVYANRKNNQAANKYLKKGLEVAKNIGSITDIREFYQLLSYVDSAKGDFKQALLHHKLFINYRDSLINQENTKKITQAAMQFVFDKKEALAKANQEKKDAVNAKEIQKQKLLRNGFVAGFSIVFLFAFVFFYQRNNITKGKRRSDELLLNILPAEVAEELKKKGSADARQFDQVTVMFTDFKGFTSISERLTPVELVSEIDTCFSAFDSIITKYHIEKIKTIGDSYMAAGGLPVTNITHASDVVKAAIEIQQFMNAHQVSRQNQNKEVFEIRIGIHTGPVVAGIVGIKKFAYDIWGDTVNLASRMESSGQAGKVNISESTFMLVKDQFTCIHRGKVEAKNKGVIDMYFVE